nr:reverse transcriptase domain-containing protein [Tanacetum cinerariifolium]
MLPITQIDTFYNGLTLRHRDTINAVAGGTFIKRRPEECYDLIENMTAHHNNWDTLAQRRASHGQNLPPAYQAPGYQALVHQPPIPQPQVEDLKGITTRSGTAYQGPTIPTTSSPPKVVECETEVTKDTMPPTNNGSTKDVQPSVVQIETPMPNSKPIIAPVIELVAAPISDSKPNQKPSLPYLSRLHDQKLLDAFLALENDATSQEVDHSYYDLEGDILLLEAFLNNDPSLPPSTQGLPQVQ